MHYTRRINNVDSYRRGRRKKFNAVNVKENNDKGFSSKTQCSCIHSTVQSIACLVKRHEIYIYTYIFKKCYFDQKSVENAEY